MRKPFRLDHVPHGTQRRIEVLLFARVFAWLQWTRLVNTGLFGASSRARRTSVMADVRLAACRRITILRRWRGDAVLHAK